MVICWLGVSSVYTSSLSSSLSVTTPSSECIASADKPVCVSISACGVVSKPM